MENHLIGVARGSFDVIDEPPGVGPHPKDSQELSNVPSIANTFFDVLGRADRPTDRQSPGAGWAGGVTPWRKEFVFQTVDVIKNDCLLRLGSHSSIVLCRFTFD